MKNSIRFVAVVFLLLTQACLAEVNVANIFGDNMVLQRGQNVNLFGTADPGELVTVVVRKQTALAKTDQNGRWVAELEPLSVGDPFDVLISGKDNQITLKNVLAGEVWICSGQSNMEWSVAGAGNPAEEIAAANWPLIRHVDIQNTTSPAPRPEANNSGWQICSPETAGDFSATAYYFARHLHQELDVPIGLINTTWGGTVVETWISAETLSNNDDLRARVNEIQKNASQLETAIKKYEIDIAEWNTNFTKAMENADKDVGWKDETDDTGWANQQVPGRWAGDLRAFDGVIWYRKTIEIPKAWEGKTATLSLGKIDDVDQTYVNGQLVGATDNWSALRNYKIPAEEMVAGPMTIAVKVTDHHGEGGFHSPADAMKIQVGEESAALAGDWKFKIGSDFADLPPRPNNPSISGPNHPTLLFNAMVNPIIPVTFKGVIWYQGESNASRAYQYRDLFPLLIQDWRTQWDSEFPFYWVQLANFTRAATEPGPSEWAELREAQSMTLKLPQTGQAVIIDIGDARDIHPKNKQDVGKRLALHALAKDYGQDIVYSGPIYRRATREGNHMRVSFDHAGLGLVAKDGDLTRFQIAGEDKKFVWANAKIDYNEVIVSHPDVPDPVAVRYAWSDNPEGCNLYNEAGLPASPFRTDNWPGMTVDAR